MREYGRYLGMRLYEGIWETPRDFSPTQFRANRCVLEKSKVAGRLIFSFL